MPSFLVTFAGALCLAIAVGSHPAHEHRICGVGLGAVCRPKVCSLSKCLLFKNATCIDDKCGCEGRFFAYIEKEKTYQDVTKMCTSGNAVLNFANFTDSALRQNDESAPQPRPFVRFFYHFNNLVTEILADLVAHLRMAAEKHPVQANIDLAKKASTSLENLKDLTAEHRAKWMRQARKLVKFIDDVHVEDEDEDLGTEVFKKIKADLKNHPGALKVLEHPRSASQAKAPVRKGVRDEEEDQDVNSRAIRIPFRPNNPPPYVTPNRPPWKVGRNADEDEDFNTMIFNKLKADLEKNHPDLIKAAQNARSTSHAKAPVKKGSRDEEDVNSRDISFPYFYLRKATRDADEEEVNSRAIRIPYNPRGPPPYVTPNRPPWKGIRDADEEEGLTDSTWKLFKAHADVLKDILNDEDFKYIPVGKHNKPGVLSDENATAQLKTLQQRAFFSSLIQTVLPVVKSIFGF